MLTQQLWPNFSFIVHNNGLKFTNFLIGSDFIFVNIPELQILFGGFPGALLQNK